MATAHYNKITWFSKVGLNHSPELHCSHVLRWVFSRLFLHLRNGAMSVVKGVE